MDDENPTVPDHLRQALGEAVEHELESTTDGHWPDDDDKRVAHRDAVMATAHLVDNWQADVCTSEEVARLAARAADDQQPSDFIGVWPKSIEEADELLRRGGLTRDLLQLRDTLSWRPRQEELDEPG